MLVLQNLLALGLWFSVTSAATSAKTVQKCYTKWATTSVKPVPTQSKITAWTLPQLALTTYTPSVVKTPARVTTTTTVQSIITTTITLPVSTVSYPNIFSFADANHFRIHLHTTVVSLPLAPLMYLFQRFRYTRLQQRRLLRAQILPLFRLLQDGFPQKIQLMVLSYFRQKNAPCLESKEDYSTCFLVKLVSQVIRNKSLLIFQEKANLVTQLRLFATRKFYLSKSTQLRGLRSPLRHSQFQL